MSEPTDSTESALLSMDEWVMVKRDDLVRLRLEALCRICGKPRSEREGFCSAPHWPGTLERAEQRGFTAGAEARRERCAKACDDARKMRSITLNGITLQAWDSNDPENESLSRAIAAIRALPLPVGAEPKGVEG